MWKGYFPYSFLLFQMAFKGIPLFRDIGIHRGGCMVLKSSRHQGLLDFTSHYFPPHCGRNARTEAYLKTLPHGHSYRSSAPVTCYSAPENKTHRATLSNNNSCMKTYHIQGSFQPFFNFRPLTKTSNGVPFLLKIWGLPQLLSGEWKSNFLATAASKIDTHRTCGSIYLTIRGWLRQI